MTESEWLASVDPQAMLGFVSGQPTTSSFRASDRKLRLFCEALNPDCSKWEDNCAWDEWAVIYSAPHNKTGWSQQQKANLLLDIVGNPFRPVAEWAHCAVCNHWFIPDKKRFSKCPRCSKGGSFTRVRLPMPWITGTVLDLATAAYEERPGRKCEKCKGEGTVPAYSGMVRLGSNTCKGCHGTGRIEDGTLDSLTLLALADALEEAGCDSEDLLRHLRGFRPCWACHGGEPPERHTGVLTGMCVCCLDDPGWEPSLQPHVRGCWALDLILGKD